MDHNKHVDEDVVELGVASVETNGPPLSGIDTVGGRHQAAGISDD